VALKHAQRNAEQDVESIKEQDIPHAEKCLKTQPTTQSQRPPNKRP
jgi:hypothetical protein